MHANGTTQSALAELIGISRSQLSKFLSGICHVDDAIVAQNLECWLANKPMQRPTPEPQFAPELRDQPEKSYLEAGANKGQPYEQMADGTRYVREDAVAVLALLDAYAEPNSDRRATLVAKLCEGAEFRRALTDEVTAEDVIVRGIRDAMQQFDRYSRQGRLGYNALVCSAVQHYANAGLSLVQKKRFHDLLAISRQSVWRARVRADERDADQLLDPSRATREDAIPVETIAIIQRAWEELTRPSPDQGTIARLRIGPGKYLKHAIHCATCVLAQISLASAKRCLVHCRA
jgi:transcriptional regulator with XRE-family HTH domain